MLDKKQRIPRSMFPLLNNGGSILRSDIFLFRFVPSKELNSRFCFSVSKKVAKKAVIRNKVRRWGYVEVKKIIPNLKTNIVAMFHYKKIPNDKSEVEKNLEYVFKKAKLTK